VVGLGNDAARDDSPSSPMATCPDTNTKPLAIVALAKGQVLAARTGFRAANAFDRQKASFG